MLGARRRHLAALNQLRIGMRAPGLQNFKQEHSEVIVQGIWSRAREHPYAVDRSFPFGSLVFERFVGSSP